MGWPEQPSPTKGLPPCAGAQSSPPKNVQRKKEKKEAIEAKQAAEATNAKEATMAKAALQKFKGEAIASKQAPPEY